ncbi:methyltransferase domain-containing protein [Oceanisphaera avium]|uniref:Methyltransferase domain-containing protein n=1 Tax=Oceanisphaera avium TaxID=1903694 RepID=A0A1Y0CYH5_9GAMM|nr:class I SAM-dependent methyltransferase [Oceanisphaera avium]ART80349.1 hypothetical protein CBP12_09475 [Oceanisphaera avium]
MPLNAINFGHLYQLQMKAAGGREKPTSVWDKRAANLHNEPIESPYSRAFIANMDLTACRSLLDMGCGSGAIGLALAPQLEQVIGVDYSAGMLSAFRANAKARQLDNVLTIERAWEEDWQDIPMCDVVVASRSTAVMDMADALHKLDSKARKRVYLTNLVGGSFMSAELLTALGRKVYPQPDYIYILNILYQMGRQPRLDYIEARGRLAGTKSFAEFLAKASSSLGELTDQEQARLSDWYHAHPQRAARGGEGFKWAFISWETDAYAIKIKLPRVKQC